MVYNELHVLVKVVCVIRVTQIEHVVGDGLLSLCLTVLLRLPSGTVTATATVSSSRVSPHGSTLDGLSVSKFDKLLFQNNVEAQYWMSVELY